MQPVPPPTDPDHPDTGDVAATYCATLVDEWVQAGLSHAVVSPGSRSTPMALALAEHPSITLHVHHDERSASFMAVGLGLAQGRAAALLCTSGTAAAQFHAAVVEAHQASVPLLVLTADRPSELQGVGAPQTIDQRDLYGTSVRWYCEPGAPVAGGAPWWRDLARDAWVRTLGERPGPVHLNLAFREPLVGTAAALPPERPALPDLVTGARWGLTDERSAALAAAMSGRRGLVVAGVRAARDPDGAAAVRSLAAQLGWPLLADGPSGCRLDAAEVVSTADALLRCSAFAEQHRPEVVLRLGGLPASKVVPQWLADSGALQIGIDSFGDVADPHRVLADSLHADVATVCDQLRSIVQPAPADWSARWRRAEQVARSAIEQVLAAHGEATEPATAVDLVQLLGPDHVLVASSSMPVRDLEWYAAPRTGLRVLANRGANGIDGVVSTAVGVAASGVPTALLIGDVAFLHDSNGLLGASRRGLDLVVVVVDNDGGGIFSFLPQASTLAEGRFEQLFGTPHGVDLCALAQVHGVPAERVSTRTGFQAAVAGALTRGGTRVVVVHSDRRANVALHEQLHDAVAAAWERDALAG